MKNHRILRSTFALVTAILITISFSSCGQSSGKTAARPDSSTNSMAYDASGEKGVEEIAEAPMESAAKTAGGSALSDSISQTAMPDNLKLKLIWQANVSMETLEFDKTTQDVANLVSELGGFVESSSNSGGSDARGNYMEKYAYLTIRIPADKLNGFISSLSDCGSITSQSLSSENISLQYADTEARKKALETEYDRLLELMAQAENVDAVIAVEARLSEVRLQLDALSSQLRTYDNLVDYSTVYLNIQEVRKISGVNATTIGERISNGFSDTLFGIRVFFEDLVVFLIVNIPVFILIAVVIIAVLFILRKLRRKQHKFDRESSSDDGSNSNEVK